MIVVATSIALIKQAAKIFSGRPSKTYAQVEAALQVKTDPRKTSVPKAAFRLQAMPFAFKTPQKMESVPKVPPEISAVFAFSGFERKPAVPARIKKLP